MDISVGELPLKSIVVTHSGQYVRAGSSTGKMRGRLTWRTVGRSVRSAVITADTIGTVTMLDLRSGTATRERVACRHSLVWANAPWGGSGSIA